MGVRVDQPRGDGTAAEVEHLGGGGVLARGFAPGDGTGTGALDSFAGDFLGWQDGLSDYVRRLWPLPIIPIVAVLMGRLSAGTERGTRTMFAVIKTGGASSEAPTSGWPSTPASASARLLTQAPWPSRFGPRRPRPFPSTVGEDHPRKGPDGEAARGLRADRHAARGGCARARAANRPA